MQKVTPEMRIKLREPLPVDAVKPHPTKTFLSSIKAIYVTERLNEVFGIGSWQTKVNHIMTSEKSMVVVKVEFSIPEYGIYYECYGGNDNGGENSKNFDLGDAYKGATTDALTKIGSYLEIGIDVFKGKHQTPASNNGGTKTEPEKWLNVLDKEKNLTPEWVNILKGISDKKINSVEDVRKFYKVSKEVSDRIIAEINQSK